MQLHGINALVVSSSCPEAPLEGVRLPLRVILESAASRVQKRVELEAVLVVLVKSRVGSHVHGLLSRDPYVVLQLRELLHFLLQCKLFQKLSSCAPWSNSKRDLLDGLVDVFVVALPQNRIWRHFRTQIRLPSACIVHLSHLLVVAGGTHLHRSVRNVPSIIGPLVGALVVAGNPSIRGSNAWHGVDGVVLLLLDARLVQSRCLLEGRSCTVVASLVVPRVQV